MAEMHDAAAIATMPQAKGVVAQRTEREAKGLTKADIERIQGTLAIRHRLNGDQITWIPPGTVRWGRSRGTEPVPEPGLFESHIGDGEGHVMHIADVVLATDSLNDRVNWIIRFHDHPVPK